MDLTLVSSKAEPKHTNQELYERQMETLNAFLERHAISQEQYDKSTSELRARFEV